jgi:hypothetical protein
MRRTFILGSGFSKDIADFPLLRELSKQVLTQIVAYPRKPATQYLLDVVPGSIKENVEHLLTYLLQRFPWRSEEEAHQSSAAYSVVARAVSELFTRLDQGLTEMKGESAAVRLVRYWHKWECDIITFNYDTLIERLATKWLQRKRHLYDTHSGDNIGSLTSLEMTVAPELPINSLPIKDFQEKLDTDERTLSICLEKREGSNADRIADKVLPMMSIDKNSHEGRALLSRLRMGLQALEGGVNLDSLYQIPINHINARTASIVSGEDSETLRLLKLHGSVNWLFSGGADYAGEQLYYTNPFRGSRRTLQLTERNARDLVPLIVPPILDKSVFYMNNSMKTQWSLAKEALQNSDEIYVVGYSMPETDLSIRFLLTEAMKHSSAKMYLVTMGNADDLLQRYCGISPDADRVQCVTSDSSSTERLLQVLAAD